MKILFRSSVAVIGLMLFALMAGVVILALYPDLASLTQAQVQFDKTFKPVLGAIRVMIFVAIIVFWPQLVARMGSKLNWTDEEIADIARHYRWFMVLWLAALEILFIRNGVGVLLRWLNS